MKDFAAPYIASISQKKELLVSDKRVEKALENLKFAKEHPKEVVVALRSKAVNLIKYDDVAAYREYVLSSKFQEDTKKLVQIELPALAQEAASNGREQLSVAAATLSSELELKSASVYAAVKRGYEWGKTTEYAEIQAAAMNLLAELKEQVSSGVAQVKSGDVSFVDVLAKLGRIFHFFGAVAPAHESADVPEPEPEPAEAEAEAEAEA